MAVVGGSPASVRPTGGRGGEKINSPIGDSLELMTPQEISIYWNRWKENVKRRRYAGGARRGYTVWILASAGRYAGLRTIVARNFSRRINA